MGLLNNKKILMQGDSWFEQINYPLNDDAKNHHDIHNFSLSDGDHKSLNYYNEDIPYGICKR